MKISKHLSLLFVIVLSVFVSTNAASAIVNFSGTFSASNYENDAGVLEGSTGSGSWSIDIDTSLGAQTGLTLFSFSASWSGFSDLNSSTWDTSNVFLDYNPDDFGQEVILIGAGSDIGTGDTDPDIYLGYADGLIFNHELNVGGIPTELSGSYASTSAVPVPAAAWLFGSGLIGLVGVARARVHN